MKAKTFETTLRKMGGNVRFWLDMATDAEIQEGCRWYDDATSYALELANEFDVSPVKAGAVISALSPRNRWNRNKIDAFNVFDAVRNNVSYDAVRVSTFNANKKKAFDIVEGRVKINKTSRKTHRFAMNVGRADDTYVTIDSWMLYAFQSKSMIRKPLENSVTARQYDLLEEKFRRISYDTGYSPAQLQAIVWVVIRNHWG